MKLSVVIPVYNEIGTIKEIIRRVKEVDIPKEIIIVDDGSTDGTKEYLVELSNSKPEVQYIGNPQPIPTNEIKVFFHPKNLGKGAALRTGFSHVTGDVVLVQDADLEYNPQEYHQILAPILEGRADAVYGSRFIGGGPHRVLLFWHYLGNRIITFFSNMLTNLNLTDMETCYKAFKTEVIKDIQIKSNRFGVEPELTAKLAKKKCRIYELPISYDGRDYSQGKKISWKDGLAALYWIIRFRIHN